MNSQEKKLGQKFLVDATLFCGRAGLRAAGRSDDLARSVNYADVYATVKKVRGGGRRERLSRAAGAAFLQAGCPRAGRAAAQARQPAPLHMRAKAQPWLTRQPLCPAGRPLC